MLNHELNEMLIAPELRERLAKLGIEPVGGSAAEFGRFIDSETERWSGLIRNLGLKAE